MSFGVPIPILADDSGRIDTQHVPSDLHVPSCPSGYRILPEVDRLVAHIGSYFSARLIRLSPEDLTMSCAASLLPSLGERYEMDLHVGDALRLPLSVEVAAVERVSGDSRAEMMVRLVEPPIEIGRS